MINYEFCLRMMLNASQQRFFSAKPLEDLKMKTDLYSAKNKSLGISATVSYSPVEKWKYRLICMDDDAEASTFVTFGDEYDRLVQKANEYVYGGTL